MTLAAWQEIPAAHVICKSSRSGPPWTRRYCLISTCKLQLESCIERAISNLESMFERQAAWSASNYG